MTQKILFICTGNTCRSLMAEHLFKKMVRESGLRVEVRSAGIAAGINSHIPALTLRVLKGEGVCPDGHIVTQLTAALVKWADLILAMETPHANGVINLCPEARGKVFLLTKYTTTGAGVTSLPPLSRGGNTPLTPLNRGDNTPLTPLDRGEFLKTTDMTAAFARGAASRDEGDIPDPFGGSREAYETCLAQIRECLGRLIEMLRGERG